MAHHVVALAKEGFLDLALEAVACGEAVDIEGSPMIQVTLANEDIIDVRWHLCAHAQADHHFNAH